MASSSSSKPQLQIGKDHNMIAFLVKPIEAHDYVEIIDFLRDSHIQYALTINPRISQEYINDFWVNATIEEEAGIQRIVSTVAEQQVVVTEASVRSSLRLEDEGGITSFTDDVLYTNLQAMGYEGTLSGFVFQKTLFSYQWRFLIHTLLHCLSSKRSSFEQFSSNVAYALVCLATGQRFNFSNFIFAGMLRNINQPKLKFLMYPRFVQLFLNEQIAQLPALDRIIGISSLKPKVFANMKRDTSIKGVKFSGKVTALFPTMLPAPSTTAPVTPTEAEPAAERMEQPIPSQPTVAGGNIRQQGTPLATYVRKAKKAKLQQVSEAHAAQTSQTHDSGQEQHVIHEERGDHSERAASTASSPLAEQDRSNINKTQSEATPEHDSTFVDDFGGPSTNNQGESADHARHEAEDNVVNDSPRESHPEGDEASTYPELTNVQLTEAVDLIWKKLIQEKKKNKAKDAEIAELQHRITQLERLVVKVLKEG